MGFAVLVALLLCSFFAGRLSKRGRVVLAWKQGEWEFRQTLRTYDPTYVGELSKNGSRIDLEESPVDTPLGSYQHIMRRDQYGSGGWYPAGPSAKGIHLRGLEIEICGKSLSVIAPESVLYR